MSNPNKIKTVEEILEEFDEKWPNGLINGENINFDVSENVKQFIRSEVTSLLEGMRKEKEKIPEPYELKSLTMEENIKELIVLGEKMGRNQAVSEQNDLIDKILGI